MIEIFRRNIFVNILLILPYILLIRLVTIIKPQSYLISLESKNIFLSSIYSALGNDLTQSIIAILLIFIQAIYINKLCIDNRLAHETTLFPGVVYALLVSMSPDLLGLTPILIANFLLLIAVGNLFSTYKSDRPVIGIFNAGMFIGLASIIHPPILLFVFFGYISLLILGSFKIRKQLQYLISIGVSFYLFYGLLGYFMPSISESIREFYAQLGFVQFKKLTISEIMPLAIYSVLFIITFFSYNKYSLRKSIQVQKKIDILYWYMGFSLISTLFTKNISLSMLIIIAPPLSILIGITMSSFKKNLTLEMVHLLLLILIAYTHFYL